MRMNILQLEDSTVDSTCTRGKNQNHVISCLPRCPAPTRYRTLARNTSTSPSLFYSTKSQHLLCTSQDHLTLLAHHTSHGICKEQEAQCPRRCHRPRRTRYATADINSDTASPAKAQIDLFHTRNNTQTFHRSIVFMEYTGRFYLESGNNLHTPLLAFTSGSVRLSRPCPGSWNSQRSSSL